MDDALFSAREKLNDVTPLKRDCGRVCGARCCRSCEGEETGMLLFPGEEELYTGREGWQVLDTETGRLAVCPGRCDRDERPLACRLFPLLPVIRDGAVREAGEILAADEKQRGMLETLTAEQDDLRELREKLGGSYV